LQLNSKGKENEQIAEIMQSYFADIGIRVRLKIADWRVHLDTVREGKIPFFRMGWLNDYPSAENSLMLLDGQNHPPEGENYSRYANPEFDRLYREALGATDPEEQARLFHEAEKVAAEDAPWVFLHFLRRFRLVQPEVRGFPMNAGDNRYLKYVWLTNES
jgi:ABC-type transport system substrate-binding protein